MDKEKVKKLQKELKQLKWTVKEKHFPLGGKDKIKKEKSEEQSQNSDKMAGKTSLPKITSTKPKGLLGTKALKQEVGTTKKSEKDTRHQTVVIEKPKQQSLKEQVEKDIKEKSKKHHEKKEKIETMEEKTPKKSKTEVKEIVIEDISKMNLDELNTEYEKLRNKIFEKFKQQKVTLKTNSKENFEKFEKDKTIDKDEKSLLIFLNGAQNLLIRHKQERNTEKIERDEKWIKKIETALKYKQVIKEKRAVVNLETNQQMINKLQGSINSEEFVYGIEGCEVMVVDY